MYRKTATPRLAPVNRAAGPCELVVALWALAFVAPKAEAVLG